MKTASVLALMLSLAGCAPIFVSPADTPAAVPMASAPAAAHPGLWTGEEPYSPAEYAYTGGVIR